jgi:hypothetical protein
MSSLTCFSGCGAIEDTGEHEEQGGRHVAQRHGHLAADGADEGDGDVEREDQAATFIGRALVQPAFDDHRGAGDREAGDGAQRDPPERIDQHARQKRDDGDQRGETGKGTDMADALDDGRGEKAAKNETRGPGRTQQAEHRRLIPFEGAAHRQKQAVQAVPEKEEQRAHEKREDGYEVFSHEVFVSFANG